MYYNNQQFLCDAMKKHLIIRFRYENERYFREAEPYALFYSTKDNILLHAFQLKDESKPRQKAAPRNYEIDKMSDLLITDITFQPDPNFSTRNINACKHEICSVNSMLLY